jgi:hypothetical protein
METFILGDNVGTASAVANQLGMASFETVESILVGEPAAIFKVG